MQLIFTHFFRPKWQHPKPGVRRQAVSQLSADSAADQTILQDLARDEDTEVRLQAIQKLVNPALLHTLFAQDHEAPVRKLAGERLCHLIASPAYLSPIDREEQLLALDDPQLLSRICLTADEPPLQQLAAAGINDEAVLEQLVLQSDNHTVRQEAVARIRTPERMARLSKLIRQKDKGVYRILKERLDAQRARQQAIEAAEAAREQFLGQLEKLAQGPVAAGDQARLEHLKSQWQALDPTATPLAQQQFDDLCATCQQRLDQHQAEEDARLQAAGREQARQQLLQRWSVWLRAGDTVDASAEAVQLHLAGLDQQWIRLALDAEEPQRQRQAQLQADSQTLLQALQRWEQHRPTLAAATDPHALSEGLASIAWPAAFPLPEDLKALQARLAQPKAEPKATPTADPALIAQLTETLDALEQAVDQGQFQDASRTHKRLKSLLDGQPRLLRGEQRARYKQINARYLELNSWQQFATRPKAEALCDAMAALAEAELPSTQRAEQLKELQRQWKALESPTLPNALRNRFQQANDRAYHACRDHFEEQRRLRAENLERREAVCQELAELQTEADAQNPDLKALVQRLRELKQQWRQSSPVERSRGKTLQRRYQRQLEALEARIDALRAQSAAAKNALIVQARSWLEAAEPVEEARIRQLQQQWRQLAPTHHRQEQQLWTEFTALCQQLHAGLKQAGRQRREEAREQAQALCRQLETATAPLGTSLDTLQSRFQAALGELDDQSDLVAQFERACLNYQLRVLGDPDTLQLIERRQLLCESLEAALAGDGESLELQAIENAWNQGEHPPTPYAELLQARFDQALHLFDAPEKVAQARAEAGRSLRLLCVRLEIICGQPSPEEDQALRLEYQMTRLQEALNEHQQPARPCAEEVRELQLRWRCTPFGQHQSELAQRFQQSLERLLG